jgi:hypothetical protein
MRASLVSRSEHRPAFLIESVSNRTCNLSWHLARGKLAPGDDLQNGKSWELWQVKNTFLSAAIRDSLVHVNLYGAPGCVSNRASFHARNESAIDEATCHNYL